MPSRDGGPRGGGGGKEGDGRGQGGPAAAGAEEVRSGPRGWAGAGLRRPRWRGCRQGFLCGDLGAVLRTRNGFPGGRRVLGAWT